MRILGGKGNRTQRSQKASCRATTSRRPSTATNAATLLPLHDKEICRKVNLCIIQVSVGFIGFVSSTRMQPKLRGSDFYPGGTVSH